MLLMIPVLMLAQQGVMWPLHRDDVPAWPSQATFFSPAKYGIIPEMLPDKDLSRANGLLEMSTFVAIVLGTTVGGEVFELWHGEPWITGGILVDDRHRWDRSPARHRHACRRRSAGAPFSLNPFAEIGLGSRRLLPEPHAVDDGGRHRVLLVRRRLLQMVLLPFGTGRAVRRRSGVHAAVHVRSRSASASAALAAGRLSGDKIELGLVPIGSIGMGAVGALPAVASVPSYGSSPSRCS